MPNLMKLQIFNEVLDEDDDRKLENQIEGYLIVVDDLS